MSGEYSDDQYRADYESRYPQFSDYEVTDEMIAEHRWDRPAKPRGVRNFESKYQTEQIGLPAYLGCEYGQCPESAWPRKLQMRKCDLDERERAMYEAAAKRCQVPTAAQTPTPIGVPAPVGTGTGTAVVGAVESMLGSPTVGLDPTTIMLVLTFIMFIFVCYCMKSIIEIKAQLKSQKNERAANI
jgi:hypothetical protein